MSVGIAFTRTLRTVAEDRARSSWISCAVALGLLALWGSWFGGARVRVLESSDAAKLETGAAARPLQSVLAGRVAYSALQLGRAVKAGEVLLRLDARNEELQLVAARARRAGLQDELGYLQPELDAQLRAQAESRLSFRASSGRAEAKQRQAAARAQLAREEADRLTALRVNGNVSVVEARRSSALADEAGANLDEMRQDLERLRWDDRKLDSEREALIFRLRREIATRQTELIELAANIERLDAEREKHELRCPIDGTLGDVVALGAGAVVQQGEKLGAVVPPGKLRVVATFADSAVGHLRPGQPAQVRLRSFPWAQFGTLPAVVSSVGSEASDGRVRVELTPEPRAGSRIPMQHGLTGSVEVEVERISPAQVVLRALGRNVHGKSERRAP